MSKIQRLRTKGPAGKDEQQSKAIGRQEYVQKGREESSNARLTIEGERWRSRREIGKLARTCRAQAGQEKIVWRFIVVIAWTSSDSLGKILTFWGKETNAGKRRNNKASTRLGSTVNDDGG